MSGFNNMWSRPSKVALGPIEQGKIYPNLVTEYLQCYLNPGVIIYCEERLFIDKHISWTKKIGEMNWSRKKNYQPVMTWLCLGSGPNSS